LHIFIVGNLPEVPATSVFHPNSPYNDEISWWETRKSSLENLGRLPRNAPESIRTMRKETSSIIAKEMKRLDLLENKWGVENEAHRPRNPVQDPRNYEPVEDRPDPGIRGPPIVINCGACAI
jgi:hypothetical protein